MARYRREDDIHLEEEGEGREGRRVERQEGRGEQGKEEEVERGR